MNIIPNTHDGSHLQLYSYTGKNDDTPVDQFSLQVRPAAHTSAITAVTQSWFQIKLRGEKERRKKLEICSLLLRQHP